MLSQERRDQWAVRTSLRSRTERSGRPVRYRINDPFHPYLPRAGVKDDLWQEIVSLFKNNPVDVVAANWIKTHATAHERRFHEMKQVREVVQEIGLNPILTTGTEVFFKRSCELGLKDAFPQKPDTLDAVIEFMEKKLQKKEVI